MSLRLTVGLFLVVLVVACGGDESDGGLNGTETTGFSAPADTTPPSLGEGLTLPLAEGFGVVCSGSSGHAEATFARLEGPFGEGAGFDSVVAFYERFLEEEGITYTRVVDDRDGTPLSSSVVIDGRRNAPNGGVVSLTFRNTVHSLTVVAAQAIERPAFALAADVMDGDPACWDGGELRNVVDFSD